MVKKGGGLVKHVWYYWLLLADSHLAKELLGSVVAAAGNHVEIRRIRRGV
jgi:hypothetical protein